MKKYYDGRHQLNMEISDAEDGVCTSRYTNQQALKKSQLQKLKEKNSSSLTVLNTTITNAKLGAMFHSKPMTPYGALVKYDADPLQEVINKEEMEQLHYSTSQLKPAQ